MLVEEMPRSFVKKNNSYSHCPLKKRPVHVMLNDEVPETLKGKYLLRFLHKTTPKSGFFENSFLTKNLNFVSSKISISKIPLKSLNHL